MADFATAVALTLKNEGGYVNDPADSGGETNFGISKRSYPDEDIKNMTVERATEIYFRDFWKFKGINDQVVANKVFDMYVNMGATAIRILQKLLNVPADGIYGPQTESAINNHLLGDYRTQLAQHYRNIAVANPSEAKFLNGWLKRAAQ